MRQAKVRQDFCMTFTVPAKLTYHMFIAATGRAIQVNFHRTQVAGDKSHDLAAFAQALVKSFFLVDSVEIISYSSKHVEK